MSLDRRIVGTPMSKVDAVEKVTGAARYAVDTAWPLATYGAIVRSERAHALVDAIDITAALARPGVRAVVTSGDLVGLFASFGHHVADHPILATDRVRFFGEPVAVVIADTATQAADAMGDVVVRYTDLPEVMSIEQAMAEGAPVINPDKPRQGEPFGAQCTAGRDGTNEAFTAAMEWGDVDRALAHAAHVVTTTVSYPMLFAYPMEPYAAQARFAADCLEVESNSQHIFQVQRELARVFDLPLNRVRVTAPLIGGGFGAKSYSKLEPLAAACAFVTKRSVRIVLDAEASMYTTRADGAQVTVTTGVSDAGIIVARDVIIELDTGAYADNSPRVLRKSVECCLGPYRVPSARVRASAITTNTVPASSYRGFGAYHTNAASEANLDQAAVAIGMNPVQLRLANLLAPGESVIPGSRGVDANFAENLKLVADAVRINPRHGWLQGKGISCALSPEGADPTSMAIVRWLADGSVVVMTGSTEMGQGVRTVFAQIAAEELGVRVDDVAVAPSDTLLSPYTWTTGASRSTAIVGLSIQRACADLRRQLIELAADLEPTGDWAWDVGAVRDAIGGRRRAPHEVIQNWFGGVRGELIGTGRTQQRGDFDEWPALWEVGVVGIALDIDPSTGQVEIAQLVTVADVGTAINPLGVRGQDLGGATQAIGGALFEEIIYDGPQIVNSNLIEYRVPRITDLAREIICLIVERGDGPGPFGSKPVGEGAMTAVGGAVLAAVADATGTWADRLPLTAPRVWALIHGDS